MERLLKKEIFRPCPENPILTPDDWPGLVNAVFNAGATIYNDKVLLIVRVEGRDKRSRLHVVKGKGRKRDWDINEKPIVEPDKNNPKDLGAEDARITYFPASREYLITYVHHYSDEIYGSTYRTYLMRTGDFAGFEHLGPIFLPWNKDTVIFPERFQDRYFAFTRPTLEGRSNIWGSFSPDLNHWGDDRLVLPRRLGRWDEKVGANESPIKIPDIEWLLSYHGVDGGNNYRIGFALADLEKPWIINHRAEEWLLEPKYPGAIIFSCGGYWDRETDIYTVICGMEDKELHAYEAEMKDLINYLRSCPPI